MSPTVIVARGDRTLIEWLFWLLFKKVPEVLISKVIGSLWPLFRPCFKKIVGQKPPRRTLQRDELDELRDRLDSMRARASEELASLNDRDRERCCKRLSKFWEVVIEVLSLLERRCHSYNPWVTRVINEKPSYEAALSRLQSNLLGAGDVDVFVRVVITFRTLWQNESTKHYFDQPDWCRIENSAAAACGALSMTFYLFAYVKTNMEQYYAYMDQGDKYLVRHIKKAEAYPNYWEESEELVLRAAELSIETLRRERPLLSLLDLGCGVGRLANRFARHFVSIVALDPDRERLDEARQNITADHPKTPVEYRCEPFEADMFEERTFDVIICSHVIQHLRVGLCDDFLSEVSRILRPGGLLLILTSCSRQQHDEFVVDGLDIDAFLLPKSCARDVKATRVTTRLIEFLNGCGLSLAYYSCSISESYKGCWILKGGKSDQTVVFISSGSRLVAQFEGHTGLQFSVRSHDLRDGASVASGLNLDAIKQAFDHQEIPLLQPRVTASEQLGQDDEQKNVRFWLVEDTNPTKYLLLEQDTRINVFQVLFSEEAILGTALASQDFLGLRRVFNGHKKQLPEEMSLRTIVPGQLWEISHLHCGDLGKNYMVAKIGNSHFVSYGVRWSFISRDSFDSLLPVNKFLILPTRRFAMRTLEDRLFADYVVIWRKWFHFNRRFGSLDRLLRVRRDILFNALPLKRSAWLRAKLDVGDVGVLCKRHVTEKKEVSSGLLVI